MPTRSRAWSCSRAPAAPTPPPTRSSRARSGSRRSSPRRGATCSRCRSTRRARGASGVRCGARQGRGDSALVARLRERRRAVDERFDPPKALAATARYLVIAQRGARPRRPGGRQLPHGHRQPAERAARLRGGRRLLRAAVLRLHPAHHEQAYRRLAALGDDSATYLWRVMAAREIMRLYRSDPDRLDRMSRAAEREELGGGGAAPADETEQFSTPDDLRDAYDGGRIVALPRAQLARARHRDRPRDGRAGRRG